MLYTFSKDEKLGSNEYETIYFKELTVSEEDSVELLEKLAGKLRKKLNINTLVQDKELVTEELTEDKCKLLISYAIQEDAEIYFDITNEQDGKFVDKVVEEIREEVRKRVYLATVHSKHKQFIVTESNARRAYEELKKSGNIEDEDEVDIKEISYLSGKSFKIGY